MDSRNWKFFVGGVATIGVTALLIVSFALLSRSEPKQGKLRHIDISKLESGHYFAVYTDALRYFVIHPIDGDIRVLAVPIDEGTVPMPETFWWKPLMRCKDFALDGDIVTSDSRFRCRDTGQPVEWSVRWQWDIRGRHVADANATAISDMYRVRFERSRGEIVLTALETE